MSDTEAMLDGLRELGARVQTAEQALNDARTGRDEAIREVRRQTSATIRQIADAAGVSEATVKIVTRGIR